jgi:predicted dehydrogenase
MSNFLTQRDCRVVAVCDVKQDSLGRARDQVNQAYGNQDVRTYAQFEDVIKRPDIDALLIATPDHWHVPVAMAAAQAGKDMYVEKPLGLSIEEDQNLRRLIEKKKLKFQFGTQQRSSTQFWQACELVRAGKIGTLKHIDVWCSASAPGGSTQPATPPATLDYERWLGPAPYTPYTDKKCDEDGKTWWFNYDYALGFIAGWGVHPLDIAYWGCPAFTEGPVTVQGTGVIPTQGVCNTTVAWEVNFKTYNGITLRYRGTPNGYNSPTPLTDFSDWRNQYGNIVDHGTAFVGSEGWVLVDRTQLRTSPENLVEQKIPPAQQKLMRSPHHVQNLLDAIKDRSKGTVCNIEASVEADILCHLSDLATRLQRPLAWDPKKEQFIGDKDANRRLKIRSNRKPWSKWLS